MGVFKSKNKSNRQIGGKTIIASGCQIHGEITELDGPLLIEGSLDGQVQSPFAVSIGAQGQMTGLIKAKTLILSGAFQGQVACEKIEILPGGKFSGDLLCGQLTVEPGGKFFGQSYELAETALLTDLPDDFAAMVDLNRQKNLEIKALSHQLDKKDENESST